MGVVFWFTHFALILALALVAYVIGRRVTARFAFDSIAEEVSICTGLGLGLIASLVLILGVLRLLYAPVVLGALAVWLAMCTPVWREVWRRSQPLRAAARADRFSGRRGYAVAAAGLVFAAVAAVVVWYFLMPLFALPLYPPTQFDATLYHLPYAKSFAHNHQTGFLPNVRFRPQVNEMLFTLMLMTVDDVSAQLVQFLMMLLVAVALYGWGRRIDSPRVGAWAAALWLSNPLVIYLGTSAYVDIGAAFFAVLAVYAFFVWTKAQERGWLLCAAAFAGFSAASKYQGLLLVAGVGIAVIYVAVLHRRWAAPLVYASIVALVVVSWYGRIVYHTGNPVFPFAPSVFGVSQWGFENVKKSDAALRPPVTLPGPTKASIAPSTPPATSAANPAQPAKPAMPPLDPTRRTPRVPLQVTTPVAMPVPTQTRWEKVSMHADHALVAFCEVLLLPWSAAHDEDLFHGLPPLSPALVLALPLLFLMGATRLRTRGILAAAFVYTLVWNHSFRDLRYLLPVLPLYALSIAEALSWLFNVMPRQRRAMLHCTVTAGVFVALLVPGLRFARSTAAALGPVPVDDEERETFLVTHAARPSPEDPAQIDRRLRPAYRARYFPNHRSSYPAYELLNRTKGGDYTLYALYDENMCYFADGAFIGDWIGAARFANLHDHLASGRSLYDFLKRCGADHFLVAMDRVPLELPRDDFFYDHFRPIYDREVILFELQDEPTVRTFGREMLKNGGFEKIGADHRPQSWTCTGESRIDSSGKIARAGMTTVAGRGPENAYNQTVAVTAGAAYRYRYDGRGDRDGAITRMQIIWSDAKGKEIDWDIRAMPTETRWKTYEMTTVAPPRAAYATILASPHRPNDIVWFDEFSFVEVDYQSAPAAATTPPATQP